MEKITSLTDAQKAQMDAWADKWIEIGLRTGKADRAKFEAAARECYGYAGLAPPKRIVWVDNPFTLALALAAPIAAYLLGDNVAVDGAVDGAVSVAVSVAVRDAVRDAVDVAVDGAVSVAVSVAVRDAVDGAVDGAVRDVVSGAVDGAVRDVVGDVVGDTVSEFVRNKWHKYIGGQFWCGGYWYGSAWASFFREVCGLELKDDLWSRAKAYEATIESACWWWPHKDFIMVCERPKQIQRELANPLVTRGWGSHRLHNETGPSIEWDGFALYHIHGVRVTEQIVMHPETITKSQIDGEGNSEVKRIMLSSYGYEKYLRESDAKLIDECHADHPMKGLRTAKLYQMGGDVVVIDLLNSTPEPDGTTKRYVLSVDGGRYDGLAARDCHAAAASTWRIRGNPQELLFKDYREYAPAFES